MDLLIMNALEMKLESRDRSITTREKYMDVKGKRIRNIRKKIIGICFDKESSQINNGFRCESNPIVDFDSKEALSVDPFCFKNNNAKSGDEDDKMLTKSQKIQEELQNSLSEDAKKKITTILNDIKLLSDIEKLLLYLQLPTGSTAYEDPLKLKGQSNPLGKKADEEGTHAATWIQSHLEEDPDVSLPKQEVYDEYQAYCKITRKESLCAADFGKVMKQIFPSVKPRRLGTRGNSRYCYSGLKKRLKINSPVLPGIRMDMINGKFGVEGADELMAAACHILFEWAEKLLGTKFLSLKELALHLIDNMFVDNKSVAAFTLMLSASQFLEKASSNSKTEAKNKKSDTQIHLQRKLQEKEFIKEQKLKLEEQRSHLVTSSVGKLLQTKKKSVRNKKFSQNPSCQMSKKKEIIEPSEDNGDWKNATDSESTRTSSRGKKSSSSHTVVMGKDSEKCKKSESMTFQSESMALSNKSPLLNSNTAFSIDECTKKTHKNKILPNDKSVCITQGLSGFIIVPSVQLSDMSGKSSNKSPKYKRIQPKPLNELSSNSVMRYRTGSLGSTMLKENRTHSYGRRSSLALMQTDCNPESSDNVNASATSLSNQNSNSSQKNKYVKTLTKADKVLHEADTLLDKSSDSNLTTSSDCCNSMHLVLHEQGVSKSASFSNDNDLGLMIHNVESLSHDVTAIKRHSEELEFETVTKKPYLDELGSSDMSNESLSQGAKDLTITNSNLLQSYRQNEMLSKKREEVSIHELESDALIDYLRDTSIDTSDTKTEKCVSIVNQSTVLSFAALKNRTPDNCGISVSSDSKSNSSEGSQLSQLRILLQQNLPHPMTKSASVITKSDGFHKKHVVHTDQLTSAIEQIYTKSGLLGNDEIPQVFLRNVNPYMNHETENNMSNCDHFNPKNLNLSSNAGITEQDLLVGMTDSSISSNRLLSLTVGTTADKSSTHENDLLSHNLQADFQQLYSVVGIEHSSTQTQVPSVPPSPNTRRRAFNFMPISPRHTPVPESMNTSNTSACFSPVPIQHPRNTVSIGVGPSQPPSNAGSPFVSPRSTPIPPARSRHSSGQSTYSTSRHTPFQNFDSGVSSISSSPFISPQPTPVPVSRLRHNSSHGPSKTVTFSNITNNQIHTMSSVTDHGPLRLRHSSGSAGSHLGLSLLSPRSAPLSPLVNENTFTHFNFPLENECRSRHSSGITTAPLSPVSEQVSLTNNNNSHGIDMSVNFENILATNDPFISLNSGKEMIGVNPTIKQTRQRHASSSVIYNKPYRSIDPFAQEIQLLLKNGSDNYAANNDVGSRSRSVPLHQMLRNLATTTTTTESFLPSEDMKSYITTIATTKQNASFPILVSDVAASSLPITSESLILHCDKSLQHIQSDWTNVEGSSDMEISSVRQNISNLLEGDDLQATLEDLRDCDTDFSKFTQELELTQHEDAGL